MYLLIYVLESRAKRNLFLTKFHLKTLPLCLDDGTQIIVLEVKYCLKINMPVTRYIFCAVETGNVHSLMYYFAFWNSKASDLSGREPLKVLKK